MKKYLLFICFFSFLGIAKSQSLMTVREIYDYNTGDIFIRKWGSGIQYPPVFIKTVVTDKYYSPQLDTLFYVYDSYSFQWPNINDTLYNNLISYTNLDDTVGTGLGAKIHYWNSNCIDTAGYTGTWLDSVYYDSSFCNILTTKIYRMGNGPQLNDSCYSYFEPFYGWDEYGKGIGWKNHYYNTCSQGGLNCIEEMVLLYYVKGTDTCGTAPIMTSVNEPSAGKTFEIFPNPSNGNFMVRLNTEITAGRLTIYNLFGEELFSSAINGRQISIDDKIPSGVYVLKIKDEEKYFVKQLIIR